MSFFYLAMHSTHHQQPALQFSPNSFSWFIEIEKPKTYKISSPSSSLHTPPPSSTHTKKRISCLNNEYQLIPIAHTFQQILLNLHNRSLPSKACCLIQESRKKDHNGKVNFFTSRDTDIRYSYMKKTPALHTQLPFCSGYLASSTLKRIHHSSFSRDCKTVTDSNLEFF